MTAQGSTASLDTQFPPVSHEQWLESALSGLADRGTLSAIERETLDGLGIRTLYTEFVSAAAKADQNSLVNTSTTGWDNRLCIPDTSDPELANRKILSGLQGGISSVELHVEQADHLDVLLENVDLELAPVSLKCHSHRSLPACVDSLYRLLDQHQQSPQLCRFSFNMDPLSHALQHGGSDQSLHDALEQMCRFCAVSLQRDPHCQTVLVDGALHHNAGASAVQELVACIASASLYLQTLLEAGIELKQAAGQISFQVAVDGHVLLNVAKLRALRVLWQGVIDGVVAASEGSAAVHANPGVIAETSVRHVSGLDNWNTHLRNLQACIAAALASTSSIMVHPHPLNDSDLADRIARNTAIIVDREAGLLRVADPLRGSYAVESLTTDHVRLAWQALKEIDTPTHWVEQLQHGRWQDEIAKTQAQRIRRLADEQQIMVGVNRFPPPPEHQVDMASPGITEQDAPVRYPMPALRKVNDAQDFLAASGERP